MHWDPSIVLEAKEAANAEYLNQTEEEIIFLLNLLRTDGNLFFQTFVQPYEEKNKTAALDSYIRSLEKDLEIVKEYPLLYPQKDLTSAANLHAKRMGQLGETGHLGYKKRMKELRKKYSSLGENIDYFRTKALDIVMSLLIDRGIPDLGHRKNLLNPLFNSIGVGTAPHERFGSNCVLELGEL